MLAMLWVWFLLKEQEKVGVLTRVACGVSAWGPSVLCCKLCSRMLSRRTSSTSEGPVTPVVEQMATWP